MGGSQRATPTHPPRITLHPSPHGPPPQVAPHHAPSRLLQRRLHDPERAVFREDVREGDCKVLQGSLELHQQILHVCPILAQPNHRHVRRAPLLHHAKGPHQLVGIRVPHAIVRLETIPDL